MQVRTGMMLNTVLLSVLGTALAPADIQAREVILFQPGQSSWEWLLVPASHDGGKRMREGKTCLYCHDGEEKTIGKLIASGEKLEPQPISGMPGFVGLNLDAAYDDENVYLTMSWVQLPKENWGDEEAATHLTVSVGTPELSVAPIAGCWAACHNDLPGMPETYADQQLTKYLPGSRNKMSKSGGGADIRAAAELDTQLAEGKYLEYWQVVLDDDSLESAGDGYFLEGRIANPDSATRATASLADGKWTVEITRPLKPAGKSRHALAEGTEYTIAVALHENHASGRHHYTSFPMRFVLGAGEAELNAVRK
ncbi:MAG TPA: ethylbenzene dehydrogenase-related protein [Xanthomonadales bacterium]|nr:ethylbenzene dehydrogenase-related protein [Xanthomonadales bacterium]